MNKNKQDPMKGGRDITQSNQVQRAARWARRHQNVVHVTPELARKVFAAKMAQELIQRLGWEGRVPMDCPQILIFGDEALIFAPYVGAPHAAPDFKARVHLNTLTEWIKSVHH